MVLGALHAGHVLRRLLRGLREAEHLRELLVQWCQFSHRRELPSGGAPSIQAFFEPRDGVAGLVALLAGALEHPLR